MPAHLVRKQIKNINICARSGACNASTASSITVLDYCAHRCRCGGDEPRLDGNTPCRRCLGGVGE